MKGYYPENDIDHKDTVRYHNWIKNLREASKQCNSRNRKLSVANKSSVTGVHRVARDNKWRADITVNRKTIYLGLYKHMYDAVVARWKAEVKYKFPNCNTTSSAYQYLQTHNRRG